MSLSNRPSSTLTTLLPYISLFILLICSLNPISAATSSSLSALLSRNALDSCHEMQDRMIWMKENDASGNTVEKSCDWLMKHFVSRYPTHDSNRMGNLVQQVLCHPKRATTDDNTSSTCQDLVQEILPTLVAVEATLRRIQGARKILSGLDDGDDDMDAGRFATTTNLPSPYHHRLFMSGAAFPKKFLAEICHILLPIAKQQEMDELRRLAVNALGRMDPEIKELLLGPKEEDLESNAGRRMICKSFIKKMLRKHQEAPSTTDENEDALFANIDYGSFVQTRAAAQQTFNGAVVNADAPVRQACHQICARCDTDEYTRTRGLFESCKATCDRCNGRIRYSTTSDHVEMPENIRRWFAKG